MSIDTTYRYDSVHLLYMLVFVSVGASSTIRYPFGEGVLLLAQCLTDVECFCTCLSCCGDDVIQSLAGHPTRTSLEALSSWEAKAPPNSAANRWWYIPSCRTVRHTTSHVTTPRCFIAIDAFVCYIHVQLISVPKLNWMAAFVCCMMCSLYEYTNICIYIASKYVRMVNITLLESQRPFTRLIV